VGWSLVLAIAASGPGRWAIAQAPTLPTESPQGAGAVPGSTQSVLGPVPGSGGGTFASPAVGGGQILGGRPGSATPRVPTSISTPGGSGTNTPTTVLAIPPVAPLTQIQVYGSLDIPSGVDDGPADGLTFDQALEQMINQNLDLLARRYEIPSARADVLTASLRANPIFYADSQLVPYGNYSPNRPGGQTQYDVNVSHPIDFSRKRRARILVASKAEQAIEALYQDAVRVQISNLGNAYVGVLAARETLRYTEAGLKGFDRILAATQRLQRVGNRTSADVAQIESQRGFARVGVMEAQEGVRRAKVALGGYLNLTPDQAELIEIHDSLRDTAPAPPPIEELTAIALQYRADVVANRIGIGYAQANLQLQRANRYADAYLLYQPYTFQNNAPSGLKSPTSYAIGITLPLPVYNRNQGNIERARLNIDQTKVQVNALEQQVRIEVRQAEREYAITKAYLELYERDVLRVSKKALDDTERLFETGEQADVTIYLNVRQRYNNDVRQYRDIAVRHRRSMFALNTAVGTRILP
jgi:cobalt-zinc-cadmium efflux system outer membrane protein